MVIAGDGYLTAYYIQINRHHRSINLTGEDANKEKNDEFLHAFSLRLIQAVDATDAYYPDAKIAV